MISKQAPFNFLPFPINSIVPFRDFKAVLTEFKPIPEPSVVVTPSSNIWSGLSKNFFGTPLPSSEKIIFKVSFDGFCISIRTFFALAFSEFEIKSSRITDISKILAFFVKEAFLLITSNSNSFFS